MVKTVFATSPGHPVDNNHFRLIKVGQGLRSYGSPHGTLNIEINIGGDGWLIPDPTGRLTLNAEKLAEAIRDAIPNLDKLVFYEDGEGIAAPVGSSAD